MGDRLYVGNLSFHTTEDELAQAFAQFGEVTDVKVILDRETGRSRGFGFVVMGADESAREAMEQMDGAMVGGRSLRVNEAQERAPRTGGGGGFGGGGGRGARGGGVAAVS